jgi:hypothetical protein
MPWQRNLQKMEEGWNCHPYGNTQPENFIDADAHAAGSRMQLEGLDACKLAKVVVGKSLDCEN